MINITGYEIKEKIYEGEHAKVFRAVRLEDKQPVIIKILKEEYPSPEQIVRFKNEFHITRDAGIADVIGVYDLVKFNHSYAIILEDFNAVSFSEILANKKLSLKEFLKFSIKMTDIVMQLHKHSIIHKDINPANFLLNSEKGTIKIIDFGISTTLPRENLEMCHPNLLEGTLQYMSPEQTGRMNRGIDYRTDYYSLGVTFYYMLTGVLPFDSSDSMELVHFHIAKRPVSPSKLDANIPEVISDIILKLMAKAVEDRYQNALELKADLQICLSQLEKKGKIDPFPLAQAELSNRFKVPEKLYGRAHEVKTLLNAFHYVTTGHVKLMLVKGYSGIGKSSLANEMHKLITEKKGYFISGKFDQFKQNIPYAAIVQALQKWIQQVIQEEKTVIENWKKVLLTILGEDSGVVTELVPLFEKILGVQPKPMLLGSRENYARFNQVFVKLIQAIATEKYPLVIFLDDLQWTDISSLQILKAILENPTSKYLLIIGSYRDNEVDPVHVLQLAINELQKKDVSLETMTLNPLSQGDIAQLLADMLHMTLEQVNTLAEICHARTEGNPFFLNQLLQSFYQKGLIYLDETSQHWHWDVVNIQETGVTENVAELMTSKLKKLKTNTQEILQIAACIGHRFDLKFLATIYKKSLDETAIDLWDALQEGLLIPEDEFYKFLKFKEMRSARSQIFFHFLHDKVRQAAYHAIPEEKCAEIHYQIGKLLLALTPEEKLPEVVFSIVNQLNLGQHCISGKQEIKALINLNLLAGQRAKESNAFKVAVEYLNVARSRLTPDSWEENYETTFAVLKTLAECLYITESYEEAKNLIEDLLPHAKTALEKADIYCMQVLQYSSQNKLEEAIACGMAGLAELKFFVPKNPSVWSIAKELLLSKWNLGRRSISSLIDEPVLNSAEINQILALLNAMRAPIFFSGYQNLFILLVLKGVNLALRHGNSIEVPVIYAAYGVIVLTLLGQMKQGFSFLKLAVDLNEKFHNNRTQADIYILYTLFYYPWHFHFKLMQEGFDKVIQLSSKSGDLLWIAHACIQAVTWDPKMPQDVVIKEGKKYLKIMSQADGEVIEDYARITIQHRSNLAGKTWGRFSFSNEEYDEEKGLLRLEENNLHTGLCAFHLRKAAAFYGYESYEGALTHIQKAKNLLGSLLWTPSYTDFCFYDFLIRAALYPNLSWSKKVVNYFYLKKHLRKMKKWADYCEVNFLHKKLLMEAEFERLFGINTKKTASLYAAAIQSAKDHDFLNMEALAYELSAKFHLSQNQHPAAHTLMHEACYAYFKWGATAKIQYLEDTYPQLVAHKSIMSMPSFLATQNKNNDATINTVTSLNGNPFDLNTVIKASQAISGELVLPKLLKKLMHIVIESAGAEKGWLVLKKENEWKVEAKGSIDIEEVDVLNSQPIDTLPVTLINLVILNATPMVFTHPASLPQFANDSYMQRVKPKTVLCLPLLRKDKMSGLLYLENNLTPDAFTTDRIKILNLITSQIMISVDNAQLYTDTTRLNESLSRFVPQELLSLLDKKSIVDIKIGDNIHRDMTVLFLDIRNFTALSENMTPQESFNFINQFLDRMVPIIKANQGFVDKYIGDAIMALFPESADNALQAAIGMLKELDNYNKQHFSKPEDYIHVGIGINSGMIMLGSVGEKNRMQGTAISDAVNIAARVQESTKLYGASLLITEETYSRLKSLKRYSMRQIDTLLVRGKSQFVTVYEIFDTDHRDNATLKQQSRENFEAAVALYRDGKYLESLELFDGIIKFNEKDIPALKWREIVYNAMRERASH